MYVDGRTLGKDQCEKTKQVVSKYGGTVVCDEAEEA